MICFSNTINYKWVTASTTWQPITLYQDMTINFHNCLKLKKKKHAQICCKLKQ